jgi:hypothetical protein
MREIYLTPSGNACKISKEAVGINEEQSRFVYKDPSFAINVVLHFENAPNEESCDCGNCGKRLSIMVVAAGNSLPWKECADGASQNSPSHSHLRDRNEELRISSVITLKHGC